jgi:hypothetical protein
MIVVRYVDPDGTPVTRQFDVTDHDQMTAVVELVRALRQKGVHPLEVESSKKEQRPVPAECITRRPGDNRLVRLQRGTTGHWVVERPMTAEEADAFNEARGVTPFVRELMTMASLTDSWDTMKAFLNEMEPFEAFPLAKTPFYSDDDCAETIQ